MKPHPKKRCQTPGCKAEINFGRYCPECGLERRRQRAREQRKRIKLSKSRKERQKDMESRDEALIIPYIPKPRKLILTDLEQSQIEKEINNRTNNLHNIPLSESIKASHREVRWLFE